MLEKLKGIEKNFLDLEQKLMDPNVTSDIEAYQRIAKEHADLTPIVELYRSMLQNQTHARGNSVAGRDDRSTGRRNENAPSADRSQRS